MIGKGAVQRETLGAFWLGYSAHHREVPVQITQVLNGLHAASTAGSIASRRNKLHA